MGQACITCGAVAAGRAPAGWGFVVALRRRARPGIWQCGVIRGGLDLRVEAVREFWNRLAVDPSVGTELRGLVRARRGASVGLFRACPGCFDQVARQTNFVRLAVDVLVSRGRLSLCRPGPDARFHVVQDADVGWTGGVEL